MGQSLKIKEADLKKHLEVELQKENGVKKDKKIDDENSKVLTKDDIAKDNQTTIGLAILKSLIIVKK